MMISKMSLVMSLMCWQLRSCSVRVIGLRRRVRHIVVMDQWRASVHGDDYPLYTTTTTTTTSRLLSSRRFMRRVHQTWARVLINVVMNSRWPCLHSVHRTVSVCSMVLLVVISTTLPLSRRQTICKQHITHRHAFSCATWSAILVPRHGPSATLRLSPKVLLLLWISHHVV